MNDKKAKTAMSVRFIKKRDGTVVQYDRERILTAIISAQKAVGGSADIRKANEVLSEVEGVLIERFGYEGIPSVEDIQDIVEEALMKDGMVAVARAYILYRKQHADLRDTLAMLKDISVIDSYIGKHDWRVKENSNMSYSLQGLNFYISSNVTANYWLHKIYPPNIGEAHKDGDIHIHDLGILGAYCVGWDIQDLLLTGFKGVPGKVASKPAKHFKSALGQIVNFFYTLQGETAGAQAFSNFDTYLAPFVARDSLEYDQVKQAIQEFIFNLNVPTRVGFQTPFTNLTMDLIVSPALANDPVIIGGEYTKDVYADFQDDIVLINKAFAEVMSEGDANNRPFTFPIPTYNITKDFDWGNPDFDPVWEMTAKYGIPYFANFVNSDLSPDDVRSMCCRLRLDTRELKKRGGGLFGANPLTGSIGVVTINLPRLGYLSKDEDEFFESLFSLMDIARDSLEIKRKVIERLTEKGLYPYARFYLRTVKEMYGVYWKNHFSTIGLIGMNEALMNLIGGDITTEEGRSLAEKILVKMRGKLLDYQEETGNLFNLEATPAEGTSYRLARIDKKRYSDIVVANEPTWKEGAEPYYTNSTLPPVDWTDDIFDVLDNQDPLQTKYTGGTVLHIYLGERIDALAAKTLVRRIFSNYSLPYISVTPTFSICPKHGYIPGEHEFCPICDQELKEKKLNANKSDSVGAPMFLNVKV